MINNKFRQALAGDASMFDRPEGEDSIEPKRFVVISAEVAKTEPSYFDNLSLLLRDNHIAIQFLVLEHEAGQNTPERLVEQLIECKDIQHMFIMSAMDIAVIGR